MGSCLEVPMVLIVRDVWFSNPESWVNVPYIYYNYL